MTNRKLKTLLKKLGACAEAREWLGDRDLARAWAECPRADWLLWLAGRMAGESGWPSRDEITLAGCRGRSSPAGTYFSAVRAHWLAIEAAEGFIRGEVSRGQLLAAEVAEVAAEAAHLQLCDLIRSRLTIPVNIKGVSHG